jgi:hypothetical protein
MKTAGTTTKIQEYNSFQGSLQWCHFELKTVSNSSAAHSVFLRRCDCGLHSRINWDCGPPWVSEPNNKINKAFTRSQNYNHEHWLTIVILCHDMSWYVMICHNMSWFIDGCPAIQFGAPVPCKPMTVVIKKERVAQTSSRASRLSMPELCITASAGYLPWVSSVPGSWPFSVDHAFPLPFSVWSCATWTNSEVQRAQTSDKLLRFYWILETWVLMVPTRRGKSQDATSTMLAHWRSCQSLVFPLGRMASLSISTQDFLCRPGAQVSQPIAQ